MNHNMKLKNKLGQYFTTNNDLKEKLFSFILNKPDIILEPSIGQGDLVVYINDKLDNSNEKHSFDMYEIDKTIKLLKPLDKENVKYGDFMQQDITRKYKTIVGNPPYIRTKRGNLYIDFTEKCYNLLEENGELIFIVPSDFLKLTSAAKLLNNMMMHGTFTHIYHPHNENLFENASIDVIIYRYCKNKSLDKKVIYNDTIQYIQNSDGLITFSDTDITESNEQPIMFKDYFDIYVGIVNGKEEVYKNAELGNVTVLNGENKLEKYIYIEKYPCDDDSINTYLLKHKQELITRQIKKFNENNWFEWGAPRNITTIRENIGKECIYIYNLTRKANVAFIDKVTYFGGGLIMLKPKESNTESNISLTKKNLQNIVQYLNSDKFKSNFKFSGRFKIGHRQLSNSFIPNELLNKIIEE